MQVGYRDILQRRLLSYLILFFCISSSFFSQVTDGKFKSKYLNKLFFPDEKAQADLVTFKYQYLQAARSIPFRTGGVNLTVGLNLANLFTQKFILGICLNFKLFPGYTKHYFPQQFREDFNSDAIYKYDNGLDSLRFDILYKLINHTDNTRMPGNVLYNFGFCFSPFPQKYGGFMLEIRKGGTSSPIYGNYPTENLTLDNAPVFFKLSKSYSLELSFKPFKFYHSKKTKLSDQKLKNLYKLIIISLNYERLDLGAASFDGQPLTKFVSQNFMDKYRYINYFGIKFGIGLY